MTAAHGFPTHSVNSLPLRVVIVDDHTVMIDTLTTFLETVDDGGRPIAVVGKAGSLREAVEVLGTTQAHVVMVDVGLPDGNGINLARKIRAKSASMGLVVITMYDDDATLFAALDAGASALVLKSADAHSVLAAVRHAAQCPSVFKAAGLEDALQRRESLPKLSQRELEVLSLVADGETVAGVANSLFMSQSTVKTHLGKVYAKLGAHNRASAVMAAINLGLIRPRRGPHSPAERE
ncbi:MAG: response regulator transcription factor [Actinomycetales bacterium]|nr:response regulator transcription factor [Actinomycetales bacterium]